MTQGIGQAVAISFVTEGCTRIVLADANPLGLQETAKHIREATKDKDTQPQVETQRVNVLDEKEVKDLVELCVDSFGRLDYAVNCAGVSSAVSDPERPGMSRSSAGRSVVPLVFLRGEPADSFRGNVGVLGNGQPSHETTTADFDRINGVNYRGCWMCSREQIRVMRGQDVGGTHDGRPGGRGSIGRSHLCFWSHTAFGVPLCLGFAFLSIWSRRSPSAFGTLFMSEDQP